MSLKRLRLFLWIAVAAVAGGTLAIVTSGDVRQALLGTGQSDAVASIGGDFTMVNTDGEDVTEADLKGKPTAMFFGFTNCPDICPTTLLDMSRWLEELGPAAGNLTPVFVTVDPERDTPERMGQYISSFDERIVGLTGTPEQVEQMAEAWRVYYRKVDTEGGGYTMDHTASIYLMDAEGSFVGTIGYGESDELAIGKLRKLVGEG